MSLSDSKQELLEKYDQGKTIVSLSKEYNVHETTIRKFLRKNGILPRNRIQSEAKAVVESFLKGVSVDRIASSYNVTRASVTRVLRDQGFSPPYSITWDEERVLSKFDSGISSKELCEEYNIGIGSLRTFLEGKGKSFRERNTVIPNILSPTQAAYLAGLIDSDGTINSAGVSITNTYLSLPNFLISMTGVGFCRFQKKENLKHRPTVTWGVKNCQALDLLKQCFDYLVVKKERCRLFINLQYLRTSRILLEDQEEIKQKIASLNRTKEYNLPCDPDIPPWPAEELKAYLAGFVDGDGCIEAWYKRYKNKVLSGARLSIRNVDLRALGVLNRLIGKGTVRRSYTLDFNAKDSYFLCREIEPYLVIKRERARLLSELGDLRSLSKGKRYKPDRQDQIISIIRELNNRG